MGQVAKKLIVFYEYLSDFKGDQVILAVAGRLAWIDFDCNVRKPGKITK